MGTDLVDAVKGDNVMQTTLDLKSIIEGQSLNRRANGKRDPISFLEKWTSRRITDREKAEFCTQLSVMLQARISIHRALEALAEQTANRKLQSVVESLSKEIQK